MSLRKVALITGETYHVFSHSVQNIPIFKGEREGRLFLEAMRFYLQQNPPVKFSVYRTSRDRFPIKLDKKIVTVICYCLMPTHFHLILRQEQDDGIKQFMHRVLNSFAHYICIKFDMRGHIFEGNFKAVRVEDEEQLVHLSRYIHLNPVTSYLVENPSDFSFSSYPIYLGKNSSDFICPSPVLQHFSSSKKYEEFVMDQKDYQRNLQYLKYCIFE